MANPAAREHLEGLLVVAVGGVLGLLLLIALVFGYLTLRRVARLRQLAHVGTPLLACVEELRIHRGKHNSVVGASFVLVYDFQHQTFRSKFRTTVSAAIAQAQGLGKVQIAVDPQNPRHAAMAVAGQLI